MLVLQTKATLCERYYLLPIIIHQPPILYVMWNVKQLSSILNLKKSLKCQWTNVINQMLLRERTFSQPKTCASECPDRQKERLWKCTEWPQFSLLAAALRLGIKNFCEQTHDQTTTPKDSKWTELTARQPMIHRRDFSFYNTANKLPLSISVLYSKIECSFLEFLCSKIHINWDKNNLLN